MKKLLLLTSLLLIACSQDKPNCNCGTITAAYYHQSYNLTTISIRNNCTGAIKELDVTGHYAINQEYCE